MRLLPLFQTAPHAYTMVQMIEHLWPDANNEPSWANGVVWLELGKLRRYLRDSYPWLRIVHRAGVWRLNLRRP
jgi:hypothetical protein